MKRFVCLVVCLILLASFMFAIPSSARVVKYGIAGDVNGDGEASVLDATVMQRYLVGIPVSNLVESNESVELLGDIDGDGIVSSIDVTFLQRFAVGLGKPKTVQVDQPVIMSEVADDVQTTKMENAKLCYDTFKAYGMDDTHIAALLGTFDWASSIDSTAVEGFYGKIHGLDIDELTNNYAFGFTKKVLFYKNNKIDISFLNLKSLDFYVARILSDADKDGKAYSYIGKDNEIHYCPGVGLLGWTGENAVSLFEFADKYSDSDRHWYDIDVQLEAVIKGVGLNDGPEKFKNMDFGEDIESATACAQGALIYGYDWGVKDSRADSNLYESAREWLSQCKVWSEERPYRQYNRFGDAVVWYAEH